MKLLAVALALLVGACTLAPGAPEWPLDAMLDRTVLVMEAGAEGTAYGSGFLASPRYIVTAAHVIEDQPDYVVTFFDGTALDARVVWQATDLDLAVLELGAPAPVDPAEIACDPVRQGDAVAIVGHPQGERWLVAFGTVAVAESVNGYHPKHAVLSAPINPGNSGGPVFDREGRVRGMVTRTNDNGLGVVVPSSLLCQPVRQALAGRVGG